MTRSPDQLLPTLHWRKFSPIDRDHPVLELVDSGVTILDVTVTAAGAFEIAFHPGASNRDYDLEMLEGLIANAKEQLLPDSA